MLLQWYNKLFYLLKHTMPTNLHIIVLKFIIHERFLFVDNNEHDYTIHAYLLCRIALYGWQR